jgi:SprT-like family protein
MNDKKINAVRETFDRLNAAYFRGKLPRPLLIVVEADHIDGENLGAFTPATGIQVARSVVEGRASLTLDEVLLHEIAHHAVWMKRTKPRRAFRERPDGSFVAVNPLGAEDFLAHGARWIREMRRLRDAGALISTHDAAQLKVGVRARRSV